MNFEEENWKGYIFLMQKLCFPFYSFWRGVPTFTYSFLLRFVEHSTEPIIQPWCSLTYCVNYVWSYRGVWGFVTTIFWKWQSAAARLAKQISQMTFRGV